MPGRPTALSTSPAARPTAEFGAGLGTGAALDTAVVRLQSRRPRKNSVERALGPMFSLRAQKKRSTRVAIRSAAIDLFSEFGVAGTTVNEIAAAAGISPRTFFNYFPTKEACVVLPHDELSGPLVALMKACSAELGPLAAFRDSTIRLFEQLEGIPSVQVQLARSARLQVQEPSLRAADSSFKKQWEDTAHGAFCARGIEETAARILAVAAVGTWKTAVLEWAGNGAEGSAADAIAEGFAILFAGVLAETR